MIVRLAVGALAALAVAGCGTTVVEDGAEPTVSVEAGLQPADPSAEPLESGVVVDDEAPVTTLPIEGTALELLPQMGIDMSQLSALIVEGDDRAALARITNTWDAIRDEVGTSRPDLVNAIGVTVDMAVTAVEAKRPADADKAFRLLNDLIDSFVGDG